MRGADNRVGEGVGGVRGVRGLVLGWSKDINDIYEGAGIISKFKKKKFVGREITLFWEDLWAGETPLRVRLNRLYTHRLSCQQDVKICEMGV